ncbi:retrovirus-related pol polyprotein from transposon TNT 1-94 [Tanacetum coccineum]|uniref:Retrovirus-related pol polyprotein from transposon TNT 1-94 n=1 Tax=Tanacetum coccineum TaxID=301880 RepID=A0ABQ5I4P8_9ASTR
MSKGYGFYCPNRSSRIVETSNAKFLENGKVSVRVENKVVDINVIRDDDPSPMDVHKSTTTPDVVPVFQNQEQYLNNEQTPHEENNLPTQASEPVRIALNKPTRFRKSAIPDDYIVYLNIEKEVYMEQSEGFFIDDKEKMVCRLKKSIYGLKQASRKMISRSKFIFLVMYVDDILLATNDFDLLHKTKGYLSKNFEMKDMGETSYVIGISIFRDVSKGFGVVDTKQRVYLEHISTDLMIVDPLTKGLPPKAFTQHVPRKLFPCHLQDRPPELIGKLSDEKLRAGNKGTSEEELELKTEYGSQFTNKLEGMF